MMIYTEGFLFWLYISSGIIKLINALVVLAVEWYLGYWLYKQKIFFRI